MTSAIEIKNNKFENSKNQLKEFSKTIPAPIVLKTVETTSFFVLDYSVTGAEFNRLIADIQEQFIAINKNITKSFQEFGQVYETLDALDKEYIQTILLAIKAAEEASEQAKTSADTALKNAEDIGSSMKAIEKIIKILEQFKNKIDRYEHLDNIEEIWNNTQDLRKDVNTTIGNFEILKDLFNGFNFEINESFGRLEGESIRSKELLNKARIESKVKFDKLAENITSSNNLLDQFMMESNKKYEGIATNLQATNELFNRLNLESNEKFENLTRNLKISYAVSGVVISSTVVGFALSILGII